MRSNWKTHCKMNHSIYSFSTINSSKSIPKEINNLKRAKKSFSINRLLSIARWFNQSESLSIDLINQSFYIELSWQEPRETETANSIKKIHFFPKNWKKTSANFDGVHFYSTTKDSNCYTFETYTTFFALK